MRLGYENEMLKVEILKKVCSIKWLSSIFLKYFNQNIKFNKNKNKKNSDLVPMRLIETNII